MATLSLKNQTLLTARKSGANSSGIVIVKKKRIILPDGLPGGNALASIAPCVFTSKTTPTDKEIHWRPGTHAGNFVRGFLPGIRGESPMCFGHRPDEDRLDETVRISKKEYDWVGTPYMRGDGRIVAPVRFIGTSRDDRVEVYLDNEALVVDPDYTNGFHNHGRIKGMFDGGKIENQSVFRDDRGKLVR